MSGVRAFGGGPLAEGRLVKVLYVDETGHSKKESITIVAGILLDPDTQWRVLADEIEKLKERVPEDIRPTFKGFHAKDMEGGGEYRDAWPDEERWALLNDLLALPRALKIPLTIGYMPNSAADSLPVKERSNQLHAVAHCLCIMGADQLMAKSAPDELAMVVAEQRGEARTAITMCEKIFRHPEISRQLLPMQAWNTLPITRVKGPPSFADKDDEPLLQIADAVAFAISRRVRNAQRANDRTGALFGVLDPPLLKELAESHGGCTTFLWD